MTGIVSERDYICKIALLGRTSKETPGKEIATGGANIITAKNEETVEMCMEKMMSKGIRHLPIVDDSESVIGMVSIKDLVKTVVKEKEDTIKVLSDFALGKGGHVSQLLRAFYSHFTAILFVSVFPFDCSLEASKPYHTCTSSESRFSKNSLANKFCFIDYNSCILYEFE